MGIISLVIKILISAVAVSSYEVYHDLVHEQWNAFKLEHKKDYKYNEIENSFRFKIFLHNMDQVLEHNKQFEMGLTSFKMELNQFADMLPHEVRAERNGVNGTIFEHFKSNDLVFLSLDAATMNIPTSWNWVEKGAVTEVKDQGQCGSCWAFSTTGTLEGQHFRASGNLVSLSEQNLIDCSGTYGNDGCNGGWISKAFEYIDENHGIDTEESYPYVAKQTKCHYDPANKGAESRNFVQLPGGDEKKLLEAIATIGPISVAIDASHNSFHLYSSGVYYEPKCSHRRTDHAVLVVGYGTDEHSGLDYWLVKNSWSAKWGESGYIKMARNKHNNCCIACSAVYPLV